MSAEAHAGGARFQEGVVVDAHVHTTDYLPAFAASVYRWATRRTVPPLFFLDQLSPATLSGHGWGVRRQAGRA
jgi:hypothetical protein